MHVRKRLFVFLFAAFAMLLCTACGRWDYSREAMKAANDAQGDTLRVEFKVSQTFTNALRAAVQDNIQPADVDSAMTMDKSIEKLLTSGCRLDVYALRADIDADKAAAQLADEFASRLAGCEDEGFISMVKADNGYFYMAVLTYKHGGSGGSGSGSGGGSGSGDEGGSEEPGEPGEPWVTYTNGTLTFLTGADEHIGTGLGTNDEAEITKALKARNEWNGSDDFKLKKDVEKLVVNAGSGISRIEQQTFQGNVRTSESETLQAIDLNGVETIGMNAFYACSSLRTVILNDISNIGTAAFGVCTDLTSVRIEGSDIYVGSMAFASAAVNTKLQLEIKSDNTIEIGTSTFMGCSSKGLTLTLDGLLLSVGWRAFAERNVDNEPLKICYKLPSSLGGDYDDGTVFDDACPGNLEDKWTNIGLTGKPNFESD